MKEKIALTLSLMNEGHNVNEIQNMLNVDYREFNKILKAIRNAGYNYSKSFSSDGEITIKTNRTLNFGDRKSIRISVKDRILKAIFISDLHIGSEFENPNLLKIVYNYAKKHDCHIIFNGGDLIDGVYPDAPYKLKNPTTESQVKKVLRVHPFDPDITCFMLYGNHDYRSLIDEGFDVARYLEERRYDLVSLGYGECTIHMKDDSIALIHDLSRSKKVEAPKNVTITYRGHSHKSKTRDHKLVYIPALSDASHFAYEYRPLSGFLEAEFTFFNKKIARINMKQLAIVQNEIRLANEETMLIQPDYKEIPHTLGKRK